MFRHGFQIDVPTYLRKRNDFPYVLKICTSSLYYVFFRSEIRKIAWDIRDGAHLFHTINLRRKEGRGRHVWSNSVNLTETFPAQAKSMDLVRQFLRNCLDHRNLWICTGIHFLSFTRNSYLDSNLMPQIFFQRSFRGKRFAPLNGSWRLKIYDIFHTLYIIHIICKLYMIHIIYK